MYLNIKLLDRCQSARVVATSKCVVLVEIPYVAAAAISRVEKHAVFYIFTSNGWFLEKKNLTRIVFVLLLLLLKTFSFVFRRNNR